MLAAVTWLHQNLAEVFYLPALLHMKCQPCASLMSSLMQCDGENGAAAFSSCFVGVLAYPDMHLFLVLFVSPVGHLRAYSRVCFNAGSLQV